MGDSNEKEGKGSEDLLSQLFDLDESSNQANGFSEPTKVDQTIVLEAQGNAERSLPSFEEAVDATVVVEPAVDLPEISPETIAEDLIDDVLADDLDALDPSQSVAVAENTSVSQPVISVPPSPVSPSVIQRNDDHFRPPTDAKAVANTPAQDALSDVTVDNFGGAKAEATAQEASGGVEAPSEASVQDFAEMKASSSEVVPKRKIDLSRFVNVGSLSQRSRKVFVVTVLGFLSAGIAVLGFVKLKSEEGLLGLRLVGFEIARAYRSPSADDMAGFNKILNEANALRLEDSTQGLEKAVGLAKEILQKDERNEEAAALGLELSARLIHWFGVSSPWPVAYDDFNARLEMIRQKKGALTSTSVIARAKAWKALAVEDLGSAMIELKGASSADVENLFMVQWLQWRLDGQRPAADKRASTPPGRLYEFLAGQMEMDSSRLEKLVRADYLPAEVAVFVAQKLSKEGIAEAEALRDRVVNYPFLHRQVLDSLATYYVLSGEGAKARTIWKQVLDLSPRMASIWLKMAKSFEEDALWDEAISAYQSAQQSKTLSERGYSGYMKLLRLRSKVVDGLKVFDEAIAIYPKSALLYLEQGFVQMTIFQDEQAKQSFLKALELDPKLDVAQFGLVQLALNRREWIEAETLLKKIPEDSPEFGESLMRLGQIAVEQSRYKDAETNYRRALEKNSKLEKAYSDLAGLYLIDEREDKAKDLVARGLQELPRSPLLQVAKARIEAFEGHLTAAIEMVETVRKSYDHLPEVNLAHADFLIQTKDLRKAYAILDLYKAQEMHMPEVGYLRVKAFLAEPENPLGLGSAEMASKVIDGVLRKKPDDLRYRLAAAQVALTMQDKRGAVEHIDLMMKAKPDYAPALVIRADFFRDSGDCQNAISLYEEAIKQTRIKAPIYRKVAQCYRTEGKSAQAVKYYQKVTEVDGSDAASYLELGRLLSEDGRFQGALKALSMSAKLRPNDSEVHYMLGFVHKELGNRKQAIASFNRFLELSPNAVEASTVRDEVYFLKGGAAE